MNPKLTVKPVLCDRDRRHVKESKNERSLGRNQQNKDVILIKGR